MNVINHRPRPLDERALPQARHRFIQISALALASWIVFGLLMYGLWKVFVWLLERVPVWMS